MRYDIRVTKPRAFSLIETVTALIILALISSSVLVVVDRCMSSAADSTLRMHAFEVARENMETLLVDDWVEETSEYGQSERYPEIQWERVVETFYEPLTSRMWVRAVCSAEYTDSQGEVQTVELTHWLTDLTKKQLLALAEQRRREKERLAKLAEEGQLPEDEQDKEDEPKEEEESEEEEEPEEKEDDEGLCGYSSEELLEMTFDELMEIFSNCDEI